MDICNPTLAAISRVRRRSKHKKGSEERYLLGSKHTKKVQKNAYSL